MRESLRLNAVSSDVPDSGTERAQVVIEALIQLLGGDYDALRIVEAVRDGKRPMEIRRELGIDARAYNAAWQRIRRRGERDGSVSRVHASDISQRRLTNSRDV